MNGPPPQCICGNWYVWALLKRKERGYGHETLIDVIRALYVEVATLGLKRIGPGVVEIRGEVSPDSV